MLLKRIPLSSISSTDGFLTLSIKFDYGQQHCPPPEDNMALTPAERRVIMLINMPAKDIADKLNISVHTVKKHIGNMLLKTGCRNSTDLALWAARKNILSN